MSTIKQYIYLDKEGIEEAIKEYCNDHYNDMIRYRPLTVVWDKDDIFSPDPGLNVVVEDK